ncbi:MAG: CxxxxCH/CxxCH domain-containing protein [Saprospiraceae bacterium]
MNRCTNVSCHSPSSCVEPVNKSDAWVITFYNGLHRRSGNRRSNRI